MAGEPTQEKPRKDVCVLVARAMQSINQLSQRELRPGVVAGGSATAVTRAGTRPTFFAALTNRLTGWDCCTGKRVYNLPSTAFVLPAFHIAALIGVTVIHGITLSELDGVTTALEDFKTLFLPSKLSRLFGE